MNVRAPEAAAPSRPPRDDELLILLYHGVTDQPRRGIENFSGKHMPVAKFRRQMEIVRARANPVSVDEIVAHVLEGAPLPPRPVAVTFDDGFRNNATVAVPELRRLGIPATFYVTAGIVSSNLMFWVDEIEDCINLAPAGTLEVDLAEPTRFQLADPASRIRAVVEIKAFCKRSDSATKDRVLAELRDATGVVPSVAHAADYEKITWRELRELDRDPLFTVGGHSLFHDVLSSLEPERMERDVELSIGLLEYGLDHAIRHYSYPEGQPEDYDEGVIACLRSRGIVCSPSAVTGYDVLPADLFHLRRVMPGFMQAPFPFDLDRTVHSARWSAPDVRHHDPAHGPGARTGTEAADGEAQRPDARGGRPGTPAADP